MIVDGFGKEFDVEAGDAEVRGGRDALSGLVVVCFRSVLIGFRVSRAPQGMPTLCWT